jgi:SAM-dependent methyltransferase
LPRPLYDAYAWAYDAVVPRPAGGPVDAVIERLADAGVPAGGVVIDAGCGTGRYASALAEAGFRVIGIDRSPALLAQARGSATYVCADLLDWQPPEPAAAVLCRGVLNDLIDDGERAAALAAFGTWLRPDGVLLADVRDWDATAARYADHPRPRRSVDGLEFSSETELDPARHLMRVRERYDGEPSAFAMRPWTEAEVRAHAAAAGFASVDVRLVGDRLFVLARSSG